MKTAVVAIQRDEKNIEEWCRWHLIECQFDRIFLYNHMCSDVQLSDAVNDRVIQHQVNSPPNVVAQFYAYNAWLMSYGREHDAALFIDLDEYAMLHGKTAYETMHQHSDAYALGLSWCFFGSRTPCEVDRSSLLRRFTWRSKLCNKHVKVFANLRLLRQANVSPFFVIPHCLAVNCQTQSPSLQLVQSKSPSGHLFAGPYNEKLDNPADVPCIAHFYAKSEEEFEEKVSRGRCDSIDDSVQYYNMRDKMAQERAAADLNEVHDLEMYDKAMHLMSI